MLWSYIHYNTLKLQAKSNRQSLRDFIYKHIAIVFSIANRTWEFISQHKINKVSQCKLRIGKESVTCIVHPWRTWKNSFGPFPKLHPKFMDEWEKAWIEFVLEVQMSTLYGHMFIDQDTSERDRRLLINMTCDYCSIKINQSYWLVSENIDVFFQCSLWFWITNPDVRFLKYIIRWSCMF